MKRAAWRLVLTVVLFMLVACRVSSATLEERPAGSLVLGTESLSPNPGLVATSTKLPEPVRSTDTPRPVIPTETHTATASFLPLETFIVQIPAPSLAGNLLGDPDEQPVRIFLPPSYHTSERRYPVLYFLPGYGGTVEEQHPFPADKVGRLMGQGAVAEMILVIPNGRNALGGSFYVNSPVTGNWQAFILQDVIGYIDANYRTIPSATGRGIAGHSMGGFAALNLGMRRPDLFSAVYALSPAFFDPDGLTEALFSPKNRVKAFLDQLATLDGVPPADALRRMTHFDGPKAFTLAYGTAFAPNPDADPPYMDYPYSLQGDDLIRNQKTWKRWQAGLGDWEQKIPEFRENLLQLKGIVIDYGERDEVTWIPPGSRYVSKQLTAAGIPHQLLSFDGDHNSMSEQRALEVMLPFFSEIFGK